MPGEEKRKRSRKPARNMPRRPPNARRPAQGKGGAGGSRTPAPGKKGQAGPGQQPGFQMGRALKTSLGWMAIILVAFLLASIFS